MPVTSTSEVAGLDAALAARPALTGTAPATGDILYYNGTNWVARAGVAGCRLEKTTQSISASTDTPVTFTSEVRDDRGWHDNSTNTSRITVDIDGWYAISASVDWNTSASGQRFLHIRTNGTGYYATAGDNAFPDMRHATSCHLYLTAGTYIEAVVFSTVSASFDQAALSVVRIG